MMTDDPDVTDAHPRVLADLPPRSTPERVRELEAQLADAHKEIARLGAAITRACEVLSAAGCDCDCDCGSSDEHDDDCERCIACRVDEVLGPLGQLLAHDAKAIQETEP